MRVFSIEFEHMGLFYWAAVIQLSIQPRRYQVSKSIPDLIYEPLIFVEDQESVLKSPLWKDHENTVESIRQSILGFLFQDHLA